MPHSRPSSRSQRGYTLMEMLVVVAIIGIFSLVAVPQFMSFSRSMKMRASMRQFAADVRGARQRAITQNRRVAVTMTIDPATPRGRYEVWERADNGNWQRLLTKQLTPESVDPIYFDSTDFINSEEAGPTNVAGDNRPDIVFLGNGTVLVDNVDVARNDVPVPATVVLKTDYPIPKHTYTLSFTPSGGFTTAVND